jgi:GcrA cell cycle regulator
MSWTEETIQRLLVLWDEGLSTAEIGRRLGMTKNAILGKAHRLDLPTRPSPIQASGSGALPREKRVRRTPTRTLPPIASLQTPPRPVAQPLRVTPIEPPKPAGAILSRTRTCQFIHDNGPWKMREPLFCRKPAIVGKPWCPECAEGLYVKTKSEVA